LHRPSHRLRKDQRRNLEQQPQDGQGQFARLPRDRIAPSVGQPVENFPLGPACGPGKYQGKQKSQNHAARLYAGADCQQILFGPEPKLRKPFTNDRKIQRFIHHACCKGFLSRTG